jgi:hypothetical protein
VRIVRKRSKPKWQKLQPAYTIAKTDGQIAEMASFTGKTLQEIRDYYANSLRDECWKNDIYQVSVERKPISDGFQAVYLSIKRLDQKPCKDWRAFQRIKNQLVGPECEFVELYPAESRLVDTANQYHLWGTNDPSYRFPLGFSERVVQGKSGAGVVQRPFDDEGDSDVSECGAAGQAGSGSEPARDQGRQVSGEPARGDQLAPEEGR